MASVCRFSGGVICLLVSIIKSSLLCTGFFAGEAAATLIVWDIGGQTMGGNMLENYIYGADVSVIC